MTRQEKKAAQEALMAIAAANMEDMSSHFFEIRSMGFNVFKPQSNAFRVDIDSSFHIFCIFTETKIQVQLSRQHGSLRYLDFTEKYAAQECVDNFMREVLGVFPPIPVVARLTDKTPSTNYRSIASLIGEESIVGVLDPGLENSSLTSLIDICSFGKGKIGHGIRLLGSATRATANNPKFTVAGVQAFLTQSRVAATARIMNNYYESKKFLLLTGGKCLQLGPSLNALHKNEAISIEADTEFLPLFEKFWNSGTALSL